MLTHKEMIELIEAHRDGKQLQWNHDGSGWVTYGAGLLTLLHDMSAGDNVRIKPTPRTIYVLQNASGTLVESDHQRREWVEAVRGEEETIVEFREVLT
jgi:hypothetical protein